MDIVDDTDFSFFFFFWMIYNFTAMKYDRLITIATLLSNNLNFAQDLQWIFYRIINHSNSYGMLDVWRKERNCKLQISYLT